ncbi:LacI family transcriptional regulator [Tabrizicola sp. TH137]|uniref:LacI family DNA-binding transcriptional regulator n=1 Tax=Tabrizicola sp. TH137 TaxID=2067452 RepID=UPI000C7A0CA0|nr:LacI family DNA-binding transcriptional regulator [Tabrizicola sp. TH137]PLL11039.1 LacI family transcriptional regulator [Tabrizicola sp. TH137]
MTKIRDIAKRAGASIATVSRVVNGSGYVSAGMRARIEAAVAELGYTPNAGARMMRSGSSRMVGVLLPALDVHFFGILAHVVEQALFRQGYHAMICSTAESPEHEAAYVAALLSQQVDGVILASVTADSAAVDRLRAADIPIVAVDRALPGLPAVTADHHAGGRLMARHLLTLGHRRIAVTGAPGHSAPVQERIAGITAELAEAGLTPLAIRLAADHGFDACRALAAALLAEQAPTALIGTSDMAAIGALHAAAERGLSIPRDLSIIGFDDLPAARYTLPPLTTVAQPIRSIGEAAVLRLVARMRGQPLPPPPDLPLVLMERGTTAPPAP